MTGRAGNSGSALCKSITLLRADFTAAGRFLNMYAKETLELGTNLVPCAVTLQPADVPAE